MSPTAFLSDSLPHSSSLWGPGPALNEGMVARLSPPPVVAPTAASVWCCSAGFCWVSLGFAGLRWFFAASGLSDSCRPTDRHPGWLSLLWAGGGLAGPRWRCLEAAGLSALRCNADGSRSRVILLEAHAGLPRSAAGAQIATDPYGQQAPGLFLSFDGWSSVNSG